MYAPRNLWRRGDTARSRVEPGPYASQRSRDADLSKTRAHPKGADEVNRRLIGRVLLRHEMGAAAFL